MSWLDILIVAILALGLWRGFGAGAIKTSFSLLAWLVTLIIATKFYGVFVPVVAPFAQSYAMQVAMAFLLVFFGVMVLSQIVLFLVLKTIKLLKLSFLDKMAGAVLGVVLGILKVLVILSITSPILTKFDLWERSPLAQTLLPFAPIAKTVLMQATNEMIDEVKKL